MEGYIGEVRLFGGNFAPLGWAFCDGTLYSISQFEAVYTILGTTFGGDGRNTFGVPDLRGRVAVGTGQGAGLTPIDLGEVGGTETVTMTTAQMPAHSHTAAATIAFPCFQMKVIRDLRQVTYSQVQLQHIPLRHLILLSHRLPQQVLYLLLEAMCHLVLYSLYWQPTTLFVLKGIIHQDRINSLNY